MDVIARQGAVDDRHAHLCADLADDLANSQANLASQQLEPVLRSPDVIAAMVECRLTFSRDVASPDLRIHFYQSSA